MKSYLLPEFIIERNEEKCIRCRVCERQCAFDTHCYDEELGKMFSDEEKCVGCQRCVVFCPTNALFIGFHHSLYKLNYSWNREKISDLIKQAENGGVILTGSGNDKPYRIYFDHLVLNASQVTNPSIDPLREPMELRTSLGCKPDALALEINSESEWRYDDVDAGIRIKTEFTPNVMIETPIVFSALSYGAISYQAFKSLAIAASKYETLFNTGEGGLPKELRKEYGRNAIVQCASGRFAVDPEYLNCAAVVEIKIGQGAKPGIGGHLPGKKVSYSIAATRMIPEGTDALSPAPHTIFIR